VGRSEQGEVMASGVDYAWSHPSPAALAAAKVAFVMRYLAPDKTKSLTKAEATALAAAGIWCGVVWESTANRALTGRVGGVADAKAAQTQAAACGMPSGRPIYFAVDFDATAAQQTQINAYLDGAASVIGTARVGIYGGYYPVKRALDAGKATWAWQTIAWSGGQWDTRAHIRQGAQKTIGGVSCDLNTSMQADFGQWMPGKTPEDDVALTAAQAAALAQIPQLVADVATLKTDLMNIGSLDGDGTHAAGYFLAHGRHDALSAYNAVVSLAKTTAAPALTDAQVAAIATQVAASPGLAAAIATAVLDLEAKRLQS
jgi:hypothetical protein